MSSPTYANGILYVSGAHPYDLYAIDVATHKILWKTPIPGVFAGTDDCSLAFSNNQVYVLGTVGSWTKPSSVAFAFTTGGKLAWQTDLGSGTLPLNIEAAAPVAVGSTVYFGSMVTSSEYALNAATGAVQWVFHASGPISEAPALLANRLYFGDSKGTFYVLNASSGRLIDSQTMTGSMFAADYPVIVGQTLYQPDDNGEIFARPLTQVK
jgi:outer membrane protein assembly factor BamB